MWHLIDEAVGRLWNNELVAFPTETVYGLGAHAAKPEAVAKIFSIKGRPAHHPLIVHIPGAEWMTQWATDIPPIAWDLATAFWPGPMTLILKKQPWVPGVVTGGQDTIGLRVPNHPVALGLLKAFASSGRPGRGGIAAPSANRFGRISPTTAADVLEELGHRISLILDGGSCAIGIESTIIDLSRGAPVILRPGALAAEQLTKVLGEFSASNASAQAPRVPGALVSHYAPHTPACLMPFEEILAYLDAHARQHCCILARTLPPVTRPAHIWHMMEAGPGAYARDLYGVLRHMDRRFPDLILIEQLPDTPEWAAVRDRVGRATAGRIPAATAIGGSDAGVVSAAVSCSRS
ncbi:MAG: threonylcarbamoyl-AMP synthase [Zoogloeaceae bacterium]|nr:threonylcarbamoyl-AMP synthase [Zoogloeaceae bacterium]